MFNFQKLKHINWFVVGIITLIVSISISMLYSAGNGNVHIWASKQVIRFVFGFFIMLIIALIDLRWWLNKAYIFYISSLIMLFCVEIMGFVGMGAQRWIDLYFFNLQPSELMRVSLILAISRYFSNLPTEEIFKFRNLLLPLLLVFIPTILVMRQPDLGTAILLLCSSISIFFVAGVKWWKFLVSGLGALSLVPILWQFLHDYQKKRIFIFLNPESDSSNAGYHITQSKIALGSGGIFGKGFMQGTQSHLNFLPEKQTDFIFTMFCEEFGLVGAVVLISLFVIILSYGFEVALSCRSYFGKLIATGLNSTFFLYVFVNIGMVMGLLPVVGIPLPFMSYGGTSMITLLVSQGLIFSAHLHNLARIQRF
jgi:rod shape determining protein RodA